MTSKFTIAACFTLFFLAHWIGQSYKWYNKTWWVDVVMHLVGGMLIAMAVFTWKERYAPKLTEVLPIWGQVIAATGVVMLLGIGWEWFEFFHDVFLNPWRADLRLQLGVFDILKDMGMDFIGGFLMSLIIVSNEKHSTTL